MTSVFCLCHESASARGFTGKYGPPCIVAVIFKSVSRKALSREVVPFFGTLCCAQSVVGLVEPWPREGELLKLITARSLYMIVACVFGDYHPIWSGPGLTPSCKPAAFSLRRLRWQS